MIKRLRIKNYQSHKKTEIEFHEGVNVIIGSTDSGKSAILRSIRWVKDNRPMGERFRSFWGGDTVVEIEDEKGVIITRSKSGVDEYSISTISSPFHAFGTNVPEEISRALNMTDVNIQKQQDGLFLLSSTAGEVATHFNSVAGLSKIDTATANINSWVTDLNSQLRHCEKDLKDKKEAIKKYDYLQKAEIEIDILEEQLNRLKQKKRRVSDLKVIINEIKEVEEEMKKHYHLLGVETLLTKTLRNMNMRDDKIKRLSKLKSILNNISDYNEEQKCMKHILDAETKVSNLLELLKKVNIQIEAKSRLNKLLKAISNTNTLLKEKSALYAKDLANFQKEVGTMCEMCPLKLK